MRLIAIIVTAVIELLTIKLWSACQKLPESLYFSSLDIKLKVEEEINNDAGYGTEIVRFFHNKLTIGFDEIVNKYLSFWNINFQAGFLSLIGLFGVICGFWYLLTNKKKNFLTWITVAILLGLPLLHIFALPLPFEFRIGIIWVAYMSFSLYGLWQFLRRFSKKRLCIVSIIAVLSIWYLIAFQSGIFAYFCNK